MRRVLLFLLLLACGKAVCAQTPIVKPDLGVPSKVAPGYFGPNAFPVPDMLDGRTSSKLVAELYADTFLCTMTDNLTDDVTYDLAAKLTIPLFSDRVNLVLWMPMVEYFKTTPYVNSLRRLEDISVLSGTDSGDAYVSTDIRLLEQDRHGYDLAIRAALKSASGNSFSKGRVYDCPGYFFDAAVGRDILTRSDLNLRVALSSGFLCWQTDNGRQNDAVMYGAMLAFTKGCFNAGAALGGYVGWEGDGDRPMTIKTDLSWSFNRLSLVLHHQSGFKDWPYHQFRIGVRYSFNILPCQESL